MIKPRLTSEQKAALKEHRYRLEIQDRYLGGVFVTPLEQIQYQNETKKAFMACKALGLTYEHGLKT